MQPRPFVVTLLSAITIARSGHADSFELSEIEDVEVLSLSELLEQPTEAASRYARKPADSPALVSTVDADVIQRMGYRTLSEALHNVRGMHGGNDRSYSLLGVRGFSVPGDFNSRIALSIDGHRINDPVYSQAYTGGELGLPMIAVERIEVLRGGAWSVYGQNALLAAIHVVTATGASRPGLRVTSTTRVAVETSADPAARPPIEARGEDISASYGALTGGGVDVFVAGNYQYDPGLSRMYTAGLAGLEETCAGPGRRPRPCDGIVEGGDAEEVGSLYAAIRGEKLAFHALAARRRRMVPAAPFLTIVGDPYEISDTRLYADLGYKAESKRGDLIARVAVDYYLGKGAYPFDAGSEDGSLTLPDTFILDRHLAGGTWISGEVRGRYKRARAGRHLRELEIAGALELGAARSHLSNYFEVEPTPIVNIDRTDDTSAIGLATHVNGRAFGHLVVFVAARADIAPALGTTVRPQGGLVLDGEELGRLRVSLGRGYRAPNVYEKFFDAPVFGQISNPSLRPEQSETLEASAERYLGKHVRMLAVVFRQTISDLIALTTNEDGARLYDNVLEVHAQGGELALDGRWNRLRIHAHASRQRVVDQEGQARPNAPRTLAGLSVLVPFAGTRGDLGFETFVVGERRLLDGSMLPLQTMTNVAVTLRDVIDRLDLTIGATNLFDRRHDTPGSGEHRQASIPGDPRMLWLRLSLDLGRTP